MASIDSHSEDSSLSVGRFTSTATALMLSIPDDVHPAVQLRSVECGNSPRDLVPRHGCAFSERSGEFSRLAAQQQTVMGQIKRFSARDRLDRDELHVRTTR
jgi:hypothetical protein